MSFITKSIGAKLGLSMCLLLILNVFTILTMFYLLNQQKAYSPAINESGKLRMMSQRIAKDASYISQGYTEAKQDIVSTSDLYSATIKSLIEGSKDRGIVAPSENLKTQLVKVKGIWDGISNKVTVIVAKSPNDTDFKDASDFIRNNNAELLKEANNAVGMYEEESRSKETNLLIMLSALMTGLSVGVILLTISIIRGITVPIAELTKATKTISRFNLTSKVNIKSEDEIGELANNFNLMIENLKSSMLEKEEVK